MSTNWDWGIFQCPQDRIGVKIYVHIYGYIIVAGRFFYVEEECGSLMGAISTAIWDPKNLTENVRLDDGTSDIDSMDAFEYCFERDIKRLIKKGGGGT